LWFCAREGFRVSGIEWSKTGVERFQKRLNDENLSSQIDEIKIGDYEQKLDEFKNQSFDCIIDSCSLCCNDFKKTQRIFNKAILKLKPNGKFFSSTIAKGIVGYDKNKEDFQLPNDGIYTHIGMIRFSSKEDIQKLYKNDNFKQISLKIQSIENNNALIDKLFIVEGEKI
ncbi:class I SAM-dependent methyltransferase, partial [Campylobacter coli]|nr:class I SAM-dependent methyltransferase [Campylobacter coli]